MISSQITNIVIIVILTVISGFSDAQGVIYAANVWQQGQLAWDALGKSALGFSIGITTYWIAIRFMKEVGIVSPEIQTTIWFGVMVVGVALISGSFFKWRLPEQIIAVLVIVGIGWLSVRTGN